MTIGVIFIWWFAGISEADEHENGSKNIGGRLDGIRDERILISKKTSRPLDRSHSHIAGNAEICCFDGLLFVCHLPER